MTDKKQAVQFSRTGEPAEVVELVDIDIPPLGANDVLIDVEAAPINPAHLLMLSGEYGDKPPLPAAAGGEGVGRVVNTGASVSTVSPGDHVLIPPFVRAWRHQVVTDADALGPVLPRHLTSKDKIEQVAMLAVNPPTAWLLLKSVADLTAGDWVIQNAANSAVGHYVMRLARIYGLRTVNVVRRPGLERIIADSFGDLCVVDGPDLTDRVHETMAEIGADAAPIKLAIDAVAGDAVQRLAGCLAPGGTVANYGLLSGEACQLSAADTIFRDIRLQGVWLSRWLRDPHKEEERHAVFKELMDYIDDGRLFAPVDRTYPLSQIKTAVAHAARYGRSGKILLRPND